MRRTLLVPAAAAALALGGCTERTSRQAVSGEVVWKGVPLDRGVIRFAPEPGTPGSGSGAGITAGKYEIPATHGLEPGKYRVMISSPEAKGTPPPDAEPGNSGGFPALERIPAKYSWKSQLVVDVVDGKANTINFPLD